MEIKLSILTPVFNGAYYIERAIRSVINQEMAEVEHIICDGGSTDDTMAIVEAYAAKYPHIRYVSEKDRGQSHAMNKALQMAQGQTVGFLNADDYYEPGVFRYILHRAQSIQRPYLLIGDCQVRGDDSKPLNVNRPKAKNLYQLIAGYEFPYNPVGYFYDKSIHDLIGLYDENEHYAMDVDFLLKAYRVAHVDYTPMIWGHYNFIKGTKTFDDIENGLSMGRVNRLREAYLEKLNFLEQCMVYGYKFIHYLVKTKNRWYRSLRRRIL